ncbi:MAG: hypothetical protein WCK17_01050 [Verrucomicrobiota bacterium]
MSDPVLVVADTTPLNYLVLIGQEHVLGALFDKVLIPEGVLEELKHPKAPEAVLVWIQTLPTWLEVARVRELDHAIQLGRGVSLECLSPALSSTRTSSTSKRSPSNLPEGITTTRPGGMSVCPLPPSTLNLKSQIKDVLSYFFEVFPESSLYWSQNKVNRKDVAVASS